MDLAAKKRRRRSIRNIRASFCPSGLSAPYGSAWIDHDLDTNLENMALSLSAFPDTNNPPSSSEIVSVENTCSVRYDLDDNACSTDCTRIDRAGIDDDDDVSGYPTGPDYRDHPVEESGSGRFSSGILESAFYSNDGSGEQVILTCPSSSSTDLSLNFSPPPSERNDTIDNILDNLTDSANLSFSPLGVRPDTPKFSPSPKRQVHQISSMHSIYLPEHSQSDLSFTPPSWLVNSSPSDDNNTTVIAVDEHGTHPNSEDESVTRFDNFVSDVRSEIDALPGPLNDHISYVCDDSGRNYDQEPTVDSQQPYDPVIKVSSAKDIADHQRVIDRANRRRSRFFNVQEVSEALTHSDDASSTTQKLSTSSALANSSTMSLEGDESEKENVGRLLSTDCNSNKNSHLGTYTGRTDFISRLSENRNRLNVPPKKKSGKKSVLLPDSSVTHVAQDIILSEVVAVSSQDSLSCETPDHSSDVTASFSSMHKSDEDILPCTNKTCISNMASFSDAVVPCNDSVQTSSDSVCVNQETLNHYLDILPKFQKEKSHRNEAQKKTDRRKSGIFSAIDASHKEQEVASSEFTNVTRETIHPPNDCSKFATDMSHEDILHKKKDRRKSGIFSTINCSHNDEVVASSESINVTQTEESLNRTDNPPGLTASKRHQNASLKKKDRRKSGIFSAVNGLHNDQAVPSSEFAIITQESLNLTDDPPELSTNEDQQDIPRKQKFRRKSGIVLAVKDLQKDQKVSSESIIVTQEALNLPDNFSELSVNKDHQSMPCRQRARRKSGKASAVKESDSNQEVLTQKSRSRTDNSHELLTSRLHHNVRHEKKSRRKSGIVSTIIDCSQKNREVALSEETTVTQEAPNLPENSHELLTSKLHPILSHKENAGREVGIVSAVDGLQNDQGVATSQDTTVTLETLHHTEGIGCENVPKKKKVGRKSGINSTSNDSHVSEGVAQLEIETEHPQSSSYNGSDHSITTSLSSLSSQHHKNVVPKVKRGRKSARYSDVGVSSATHGQGMTSSDNNVIHEHSITLLESSHHPVSPSMDQSPCFNASNEDSVDSYADSNCGSATICESTSTSGVQEHKIEEVTEQEVNSEPSRPVRIRRSRKSWGDVSSRSNSSRIQEYADAAIQNAETLAVVESVVPEISESCLEAIYSKQKYSPIKPRQLETIKEVPVGTTFWNKLKQKRFVHFPENLRPSVAKQNHRFKQIAKHFKKLRHYGSMTDDVFQSKMNAIDLDLQLVIE